MSRLGLSMLLWVLACCSAAPGGARPFNVTLPTWGGMQFWSDTFWYRGWRIQRHAWTGHSRLLDPRDRRRAFGSRELCKGIFDSEYRPSVEPLEEPRLVVLLHGLGRTRGALQGLDRHLSAEGFATARVSYASSRASIDAHADDLEDLLGDLPAGVRVDFVTHSLGGLVALDVLARLEPWRRLERGRLVQLAPPNQGSTLAEQAANVALFRVVMGPALTEIAWGPGSGPVDPDQLEVGVIGAGRGKRWGWNPLVPGDDDGVVGLDEVRLEGATEHLVVPGVHTFLMKDPHVHAAVAAFLQNGEFAQD